MDRKEKYKSWIRLTIVLLIAFIIAGIIIKIPYVSIGKLVLWSSSCIILIVILITSIFKFIFVEK